MSASAPTPTPAVLSTPDDRPAFLFVKIPLTRHAVDPLHQREDRIDQALRARGVGMVIGWGDSLGAARTDVDISMVAIAKSVAIFVGVPLVAGALTRSLLVRRDEGLRMLVPLRLHCRAALASSGREPAVRAALDAADAAEATGAQAS